MPGVQAASLLLSKQTRAYISSQLPVSQPCFQGNHVRWIERGDWRPPESQSSLIQSLSHFRSCDTCSHDNQVGGQSGYLFDQGKIPHMPASHLKIKEGMQIRNSSLWRCNKLMSDRSWKSSPLSGWGILEMLLWNRCFTVKSTWRY